MSDKLLYGATIEQYEMEEEEVIESQTNAILSYDYSEFVNAIGTPEFKDIYNSFINEIKITPFEKQREFSFEIFRKIKEVYDFEFNPFIDIENEEDLNDIYEFITFIEFDYIDLYAYIWKFLNVDLKSLDIRDYVENNKKRTLKEIEEQNNIYTSSALTKRFLNTYHKDDMINLFIKSSEKSRMLIQLRIMQLQGE